VFTEWTMGQSFSQRRACIGPSPTSPVPRRPPSCPSVHRRGPSRLQTNERPLMFLAVPPLGAAARLRPGCLAWRRCTEPNSGRTNLEEGGECWFCDLAFLPSANVTQSPLSCPPPYSHPTSCQTSQRRSGGYQDKMRSLSPVKAIPWPRNLARSSISTTTSAAGPLLLS
jgi:hypothetical protein